jgi:sugar transferase EpsL
MRGFYSKYGKRIMDLAIALPALLLLAIPLAILALIIKIRLGGPVLFRQLRPGYHAKPFQLYKFRSMTDERDSNGNLLPDEKRLTRFGKSLRAMSLDELPELFNVVKGQLSIVGPRPLLMQYLDRYTAEQARRHDVKPGITGWAQVNGRNAISWEQKFAFDIWYVDHLCFSLDIKIIALTLWKALTREGINQPGQATAEEFNPQLAPQRNLESATEDE